MNKKGIIVVVVLLMLLNIASIGFLWWKNNPRNDDKRQHERITEFVVHELKLDNKQQDIYQELIKAHHNAMRTEDDNLRNAKDDFYDLINKDKIDSLELLAFADKLGKEEAKINVITLQHFQQLKAICNKKQQETLASLLREILHRMKNNGQGPGKNGEGSDNHRPPPLRNSAMGENPPPPPGEGDRDASPTPN